MPNTGPSIAGRRRIDMRPVIPTGARLTWGTGITAGSATFVRGSTGGRRRCRGVHRTGVTFCRVDWNPPVPAARLHLVSED